MADLVLYRAIRCMHCGLELPFSLASGTASAAERARCLAAFCKLHCPVCHKETSIDMADAFNALFDPDQIRIDSAIRFMRFSDQQREEHH